MRKRSVTIANIEKLFSQLNIPTYDRFVTSLPDRYEVSMDTYYLNFSTVYNNSLFYLYDSELQLKLDEFMKCWSKIFKFCYEYFKHENNGIARIGNEDVFQRMERWKESDKLKALLPKSISLLKEVITNIRENYPEIDLDALSKKAWDNFRRSTN